VRWAKPRVLCGECEGGDDVYAVCPECKAFFEAREAEKRAKAQEASDVR
jgi:hypothetical protein